MKFLKRITLSCRHICVDGKTVLTGIIIVLLAGMLSRLLSGSPIYMLRFTGLWHRVPKAWMFTIIWTFWYVLLGFCFGFVLGSKTIVREVHKYKGSLWFVVMMVFNIIWYPLFFKAGAVFLSLVDVALIILFCFLAAWEYLKLYKFIGVMMLSHILWLFWCFFINLKAFFSI